MNHIEIVNKVVITIDSCKTEAQFKNSLNLAKFGIIKLYNDNNSLAIQHINRIIFNIREKALKFNTAASAMGITLHYNKGSLYSVLTLNTFLFLVGVKELKINHEYNKLTL